MRDTGGMMLRDGEGCRVRICIGVLVLFIVIFDVGLRSEGRWVVAGTKDKLTTGTVYKVMTKLSFVVLPPLCRQSSVSIRSTRQP